MKEIFKEISGSTSQIFAVGVGLLYLTIGIGGLAFVGVQSFPLLPHGTFIIFGMNPLHCIIHLVVGIVWLVASIRFEWSKRVNIILGIVFGTLTLLGLFNLLGFLGVNGIGNPDNFLHLMTGAFSLYFGTTASEGAKPIMKNHRSSNSSSSPWVQ